MPVSEKQFTDFCKQVLGELESLGNHLDRVEDQLTRLNVLITGNGSPERGVIVRLDRLEQSTPDDLGIRVDRIEQREASRAWLTRAALVAGISALVASIASVFK